jgi:DNA ligase-1
MRRGLLAALVEASQRVGATGARLNKVRELAALLRALAPGEIGIGTLTSPGNPQGSIGLGYATLQEAAASPPAARASLSVADVDQALSGLAQLRGAGSAARRSAALRELFARATPAEQQFLGRLLSGELRQGALTGVMLEALAAAAQLPVQRVRRAAMYSKHLGAVAAAALLEGETALDQFQLQLFSPVAPMLAQTAADVGTALQELPGELAFEWKMDGGRGAHPGAQAGSDGAHLHPGAQ